MVWPSIHSDGHGGKREILPAVMITLLVISLVFGGRIASAQVPERSPADAQVEKPLPRRDTIEIDARKLLTPATDASINKGLAFLAARQHTDGSFGSGSIYRRNVAVTGLAGMSMLAAGSTPSRGKYATEIKLSIDFILKHSKPSGYILCEESPSHGPMYGHGFATLYLAEVYGMTPQENVRTALKNAVNLIVGSQNPEGGWRYDPDGKDADISVTVCQMMALRAARNAGIAVPRETVDRCTEYVKKCQNGDGGFRYRLEPRPQSQFPRSAAALVALNSAGIYEGPEIRSGIEYLLRFSPRAELFRYENHFYYGHYYAVQVMWHRGGEGWENWYSGIRDELVERQLPDGSWPDSLICAEYGTAMACLILQMPNNYLPIFQR